MKIFKKDKNTKVLDKQAQKDIKGGRGPIRPMCRANEMLCEDMCIPYEDYDLCEVN